MNLTCERQHRQVAIRCDTFVFDLEKQKIDRSQFEKMQLVLCRTSQETTFDNVDHEFCLMFVGDTSRHVRLSLLLNMFLLFLFSFFLQ
jgi:hypothetical protein